MAQGICDRTHARRFSLNYVEYPDASSADATGTLWSSASSGGRERMAGPTDRLGHRPSYRTYPMAASPSRSSLFLLTATGALLVGLAAGPVLGAVTAPQRTVYAAPSAEGDPAEHTLSVAGSGKVNVVPDMAA